jgi:hypothetical protein
VFQNDELKDHLETSFSVESQSAVVAEWNMNIPDNILKLGNYRYREDSTQYSVMPNIFDINDAGNFYTGATDSDITVSYGFEDEESTPQLFTSLKEKEKQLYSLEDCLKPFRPRSGINKLSYFPGKHLPFENRNMYLRPRYYMPTKNDEFKYWRSFRTESNPLVGNNIEYGISKNKDNGNYVIEDCNPFVAYKELVPANRIVLKVQTNIGSIDLGPFKTSASTNLNDPFFGEQNKTVPKRFKIQYLNSNDQWVDAYNFDDSTLRDDGVSPVFETDGYLSIEYGIEIPSDYKDNFSYISTLTNEAFLPKQNFIGNAYLILETPNAKGRLKIWNGFEYDERVPRYKWFIGTDGTYENTHFVTDFTDPSYYNETESGEKVYREFVWIKGIRIVVETMSLPGIPLELIEISPRLVANLSDNLVSFNVTKALADLSGSALPVGQIMAGVGDITIFDSDNSFNSNNKWNFETESGSIIAKHVNKNIKFVFYEVIKKVNNSNYYVPIKTMYSETFPERDARTGETSLSLRDFYFNFEALQAPRILITDASLSQAVCLLLDSVGFSNYVFKRLDDESDPVIPYFFIPPDQSVAEILSGLARATQSAMFFDEFNNFVVVTKKYLLNDSPTKTIDATLYGSNLLPAGQKQKLANIVSVSSEDKKVYNSGTINYTSRYIERTGGTVQQQKFNDKNYIYKPSLLWEVAGSENTKSANDEKTERFALSAVPLNTNLSNRPPRVSDDGELVDNVFDVGENAYWLSRYQGLFVSNGEVIKYDAVEFALTGLDQEEVEVWISSRLEYQKYFSELPFNGKMYPTGLVRIYAEPFFETLTGTVITEDNLEANETKAVRLKTGPVVAHGRGQFGTPIVEHKAGLDPYWTSNDNIQGCEMNSSLLYTTELPENRPLPPTISDGKAGLGKLGTESTNIAKGSQRHGLIRNFLSSKYNEEKDLTNAKTSSVGVVQSSALVMTGPSFAPALDPRDYVSYVYKKLNGAYKHFGTRVRIIGKIESAGDTVQSVVGGMSYFTIDSALDPTDKITVGGGSAGINLVNPKTNIGYYFEIAALTAGNIEQLLKKPEGGGPATQSIENILFYKVQRDENTGVLAGGAPKSVKITAIDTPTSISYRVVGGNGPIAGTLDNPKTVPDSEITMGPGTVSNVTQIGETESWQAVLTITGPRSISLLRVGDTITATPGSSSRLFGGTPESVKVTAVDEDNKEILYRVVGGLAPLEGNVTQAKTVPQAPIVFGDDGNGTVQQITKPTDFIFGPSATVSDIKIIEQDKIWQATLTGLETTANLSVGNVITATNSTGKLFGGSPDSVSISKIVNSTSIKYRVVGGSTPIVGVVSNVKTTRDFGAVWDARLAGLDLAQVAKLRVGDVITASAGTSTKAIPTRLWGGIGDIKVDDGLFAGQGRITGQDDTTVYDLAIEYVDVGTRRDFYLYINNTLVQVVPDFNPLPIVNQSVGLFVRGPSKAMFENIYALSKNYATNTVFDVGVPIASVFTSGSNKGIGATDALRKYAVSSFVQNTYLSGIKPNNVTDYSMYFEEFGTVMREAAYFNIKYDRAYPALYAKVAPTLNRLKGFTVSGFTADSYGAEFLIFNNTDSVLNLSEKNQNYLRILGIAFTQNTTNSLTVDDYLKRKGNLSDPQLSGSTVIESPFKFTQQYDKVKQSRILYGKNDFTLDSIYIQDQDSAEDILGWIIEKNIRPRKFVGLNIFSMPTLQLGDVVNINYKDNEGIDLISPESTNYVVYNINYAKSVGGPEMTVYLSEV